MNNNETDNGNHGIILLVTQGAMIAILSYI